MVDINDAKVKATSATSSRGLADRAADVANVANYGTDGTAAVNAVNGLGRRVVVPYPVTAAVNPANLRGPYVGPEQVTASDGYKRATFFSAVAARPSVIADPSSPITAFNGDVSKVQFAVEHRITGTGTLGQPATGYAYTPEAYPHYTYLYNTSGWNESTSGNDGRTAAVAHYVRVYQAGLGDCMAFAATAFVTGAKAGATSFLANPAGTLYCGSVQAGADGVYLNPVEINCNDNGYDVAGVNYVANQTRTNDTGALGAVWYGFRSQSKGSKPIDAHFSAAGAAKVGLDLTPMTSNTTGSFAYGGIALKADDRIYFNATPGTSPKGASTLGSNWMEYDTGIGGLLMVINNASAMQITSSAISISIKNQQLLSSSFSPSGNGYLAVEATSNTQLTFKYKGTDGTIRSATMALT